MINYSPWQAFKAANTNCRLEDFIRWYSPRDWVSVPITKPVIPDSSNLDLEDAVDKDETVEDSADRSSEHSNTEFANLDVDGNTEHTASSEAVSEAVEFQESRAVEQESVKLEDVQMDCDTAETASGDVNPPEEEGSQEQDGSPEEEASPEEDTAPVPVEEAALTQDPTEPEPQENMDTTDDVDDARIDDVDDARTNNSQSDDEFLDAEDDFFNSEKSDSLFKSASEASERIASASPLGKLSDDEFALSHISEDVSSAPKPDSNTSTDEPIEKPSPPAPKPYLESSIKYEQPLDPGVYGGHLSARMAKESVWKEVWYVAKPIPIWHQKRLFDDTKEAERILHHFTQCQIKSIAQLMLPPLLHAAYDRTTQFPDSNVSFIKDKLDGIYKKLKDLHRYPSDDTEYYKEIIKNISECEVLLSKYYSLRKKLSHQEPKVQPSESSKRLSELERRTRRNVKGPKLTSQTSKSLSELQVSEEELLKELISSEIELPCAARSSWGNVIQRLFHAQQIATANKNPTTQPRHVPIFPLPVGREYILQTLTRHPSPVSRVCPQRMFVTLSGSEFRVAYANSSDKTFL